LTYASLRLWPEGRHLRHPTKPNPLIDVDGKPRASDDLLDSRLTVLLALSGSWAGRKEVSRSGNPAKL